MDKLVIPNSSIVKAHSYNSNGDEQIDSKAEKKNDVTSARYEENRMKMFSEEDHKENGNRDSYSNPTLKDKKKTNVVKKFGSSDSEMIDSNFEFASNNTQNLIISKNNESHNKSHKSGQENPPTEINDVNKLLETLMSFMGREENVAL